MNVHIHFICSRTIFKKSENNAKQPRTAFNVGVGVSLGVGIPTTILGAWRGLSVALSGGLAPVPHWAGHIPIGFDPSREHGE